jgi:ferric-dicitrate binding protein FerR (iron transport regulator)
MNPETFKLLLTGYYAGTLTNKEKLELSALLHDPQYREQLEQLFSDEIGDPAFNTVVDGELLELMYQQVQLRNQPAPVRRISSYRSRWAAAAAVILLMATGTYFLFFHQSQKQAIVHTQEVLKNDVAAPAYTKAVLLLADGKEVILDSSINGQLAVQENIHIIKSSDGQLIYKASSSLPAAGSHIMNTLTVPRGSRPLQLILTDGTKIWLNAASSITYPVAFTGSERKVQMSGEAYYEVAKDAGRKFYVSANGIETEVLGTHFNVNAYEDETNIKVTLLEGGVRVSTIQSQTQQHSLNDGHAQTLSPGQQAQWKNGGMINVLNDVNTDEVMAWKNGFFDFSGADIQSVMRQLARWYNIDVEYKGKIPDSHFSGIISRNNNVSQVLKMLQSTGVVRFNIETDSPSGGAGKISVLPE